MSDQCKYTYPNGTRCDKTRPNSYNSTIRSQFCPQHTYEKAMHPKAKRTAKTAPVRTKSDKSKAMANADKWFSRYIRIKYAYQITNDGEPICKCIVSPDILRPASGMDNGHCFSRENKATRYEEDNCRPQNRSSNRFSGEADHYKFIDNLTAEIGPERFARIDQLRRELGEDNEQFYKEMAKKYRKLVNELIEQLGVNKWW